VQPAALDRDIRAQADRLAGQVGSQRLGIRTRDLELDARNRLPGEPPDLVDVRPSDGDP
jgi:hypothetical protein